MYKTRFFHSGLFEISRKVRHRINLALKLRSLERFENEDLATEGCRIARGFPHLPKDLSAVDVAARLRPFSEAYTSKCV